MRLRWFLVIALAAVCTLGAACGDDSGDSNGGGADTGDGDGDSPGDGDGDGGDGDGDAAEVMCVNTGEINADCPVKLPPFSGTCAPRGECCHRASNSAKIDMLDPDEPAVLEYRLTSVVVTNHPDTVSQPVLLQTAATRADTCAGEQCLLWRFTLPRSGGEFVAGAGKSTIGIGRYNCDGTYSFYGPTAAPDREGLTDPARWEAVEADMMVDPDLEGRDARVIPFGDNPNRRFARSPFTDPAMDMEIDWELVSQGFDIIDIDTADAGEDCQGTRSGEDWIPAGQFLSYAPLEPNSHDITNQISQTYCQLLAVGILPEGMQERDCLELPRCTPGDEGCDWGKLPDSLCPDTDAERDLFGCHLGAEGNPNGDTDYPDDLNCTQDAPTEVADPDSGSSAGQCCDPLGASEPLPACNAYLTLTDYTAAAVEITDEPKNEIAPVCEI